jgi:hypothetical protein
VHPQRGVEPVSVVLVDPRGDPPAGLRLGGEALDVQQLEGEG